MRKHLIRLLIGGLFLSGWTPAAFGQATDRMIFGNVSLAKGIGRYRSINYGVGFTGRIQQPLTRKVALTAKVGLELYRISYAYSLPSSYIGFGYNAITGFGFNTIYYNYYGYEYRATAISIPVHFGPRVYLTDQVHADLNVGVDIAANRNATSVLRVEPGVGYMLPLRKGGFLDINAGFFTSFARGSGALTVGVAYGLPFNP